MIMFTETELASILQTEFQKGFEACQNEPYKIVGNAVAEEADKVAEMKAYLEARGWTVRRIGTW